MLGVECGIVTLTLSSDGYGVEVLTHKVDTAVILVLCDLL